MGRSTVSRWVVVAVAAAGLAASSADAAGAYERPTSSRPGIYGQAPYAVAEERPICSDRVCVHYVATTDDAPPSLADDDGDGLPDTIATIARQAEIALERQTGPLGWPAPVPDGARGGQTDLVDLYVRDLQGRAAAVTGADSDQSFRGPLAGFVVLDRSYAAPGQWPSDRLIAAHEFTHLEQFALDPYDESWFAEATANWMVDAVDPRLGSIRGAAATWATMPGRPLLSRRAPNDDPAPNAYAAAVFVRWLETRYGTGVVLDAWKAAATVPVGSSFVPSSVDAALGGRSTFADEYARFVAASAEWGTPAGGLGVGGVPDVARAGTLRPGEPPVTATLDHTAYALYDVPVREGAAVTLRAAAPDGTAAAVALVGRRSDGTVDVALQRLPSGGPAAVGLDDPARYERITAVLANADLTRTSQRRDSTGQWVYARDGQPLQASVETTPAAPAPNDARLPAAPGPAPGGAASSRAPGPVIAERPRVRLALTRLVVRGGRVTLTLRLSRTATVRIALTRGPHVLARRAVRRRGGVSHVTVRLTGRERRALRGSRGSRAAVRVDAQSGVTGTATVRRPVALRALLRRRSP